MHANKAKHVHKDLLMSITSMRHFRVALSLLIRARLGGNLCTRTRFEEEAKLNSEMEKVGLSLFIKARLGETLCTRTRFEEDTKLNSEMAQYIIVSELL